MKIPASLREAYADQLTRYRTLQKQVDDFLRTHKRSGWHYESRVKGEESFTLKVESGRVKDPFNLEDFFA
ncbi:hypothetical protein AB4043_18795, partial [Terriglobus sp. YAF25]|uniref:hypothetical protein n=1 Tax=Terriglobus sp. YAF25 TaxID=3233080 RepID=UPI003F9AF256